MQDAVDVRFSKNELSSLVKAKGTCVTLEKKTRVVFLLPSQLSDIKTGIKEYLDSNLLKYDYETKAIIIGYEKIKILSKYGSICYGYTKIALRIEANLYLFKPVVGRILKGVVCKQSGRHLGCLVHKGFNVSIPLEDEDACGWDFTIGQDVKFTVIKLDLTSGPLPYILGQLFVDGVNCEAVDGGGVGSEASQGGGTGAVVGGGGEDRSPEGDTGAPGPQQARDCTEFEGHWEVRGGSGEWHEKERAQATPAPQETGDGRENLISQLMRNVEMTIGEVGPPKKGKQKRVSLDPEALGRKGPRALPGIPLTPPLGKAVEHLPVVLTPMATPPSGGKGGPKRAVTKKGVVSTECIDSGSIIDHLMEMSRRKLLGAEAAVETPRGKKRKAEEGLGEDVTKRKVSRKAEGSCVTSNMAQVAVKREGSLQSEHESTNKQQLPTGDPGVGVKWGGTPLPNEKLVPSKTHKLSHCKSKVTHVESVSGIDDSNLSTPELLEPTNPPVLSRVTRKSLTLKSETCKNEK